LLVDNCGIWQAWLWVHGTRRAACAALLCWSPFLCHLCPLKGTHICMHGHWVSSHTCIHSTELQLVRTCVEEQHLSLISPGIW